MDCNYPECSAEATRAFVITDVALPRRRSVLIRCEEHAVETEAIVKIAELRPRGLVAEPGLREISLEEALVTQVMEE